MPINFLPLQYISRPSSFIVNTLPVTDFNKVPEGEHWFALFIPTRGPIEYFDSYGGKPINSEVYRFCQINRKKIVQNKFKIQANTSIKCGDFSVFYLFLRSRNISMKRIVKFFIRYKHYNDKIIESIFNKLNST